ERDIEIRAGGRGRLPSSAAHATSAGRLSEKLAEDVVRVESVAAGAGAAKLEMRSARPGARPLRAAEGGEGIAARVHAFEVGEARLAGRFDLRAVLLAALFVVADDLIGLVDLGEEVLGLGIVRVLVRVVLFGELAERGLDVLLGSVLRNAQDAIGIAHL